MNNFLELKSFYSGKKVFLTGHTGFKGGWLSLWLSMMGAKVAGFALKADEESIFNLAKIADELAKSTIGDIRNAEEISAAVKNPTIGKLAKVKAGWEFIKLA